MRAIITDLDRTLLHTDKSLSPCTISVLKKCREAGIRVMAATARPERTIRSYREVIAFDAVTTLNGARIFPGDRVIENAISKESCIRLLRELERFEGCTVSLETGCGFFANRDIPEWQPVVCADLKEVPEKTDVFKIIVSSESTDTEQIIPCIGTPDTYTTVADRTLLQIMSRSATKWNGIQLMLQAFGIDPADAVYFGDDHDDIEPVRMCGLGVAVSNAIPEVLNAADAVCASNDEDGPARFLAEYILRDMECP